MIKIRFTKEERKEYEKVEKLARRIYQQIKSNDPTNISKNYLKISSALLPRRDIAIYQLRQAPTSPIGSPLNVGCTVNSSPANQGNVAS